MKTSAYIRLHRSGGRIILASIAFCWLVNPAIGIGGSVGIGELEWLAGCWASNGAETGSGEQWMRPAGGTMMGINRTVRNGRTTAYEFMRIVETDDEDGGLLLIASPSGQTTTTFLLASISEDEVVFENPDHDFPQRIGYRRLPNGGLLGWIDGSINDQNRRVEFPMTASGCVKEFAAQ